MLFMCAQPLLASNQPPASQPDTTATAKQPLHDVQAKASAHKFQVAPNPATGLVAVKSPSLSPYTYFLYSNGGALLLSGTAIPSQGELSLDLSTYPSGTYFLRVQSPGNEPQLLPVVRR